MKLHTRKRQLREPSRQMAALYAVYINVLIYLLFIVMFFYGQNAVIPATENQPPNRPQHPMNEWLFLTGIISNYLYIFALLYINFLILKQEKKSLRKRTILAILASLIFVIVWNQVMMTFHENLFDFPKPDARALKGGFMRDFLLGTLTVLSAQFVYLSYRRQLMAIENQTLKAEYERARYETLKNQIDPHFLFNTLNTLNSIVVKDPQQAQKYIQKLSSIFRYTIHTHNVTTLEEELAFTKNYCALMSIRYGENLEFEFNIQPEYNSYSIVPFSLQTLVENAIKHNTITSKQKLKISISSLPGDFVTVSNPVSPKNEQETGEGVGLANLSERCRLKWEKDIIILNDGKTFSVHVPLVQESKNAKETES